jgi:hypothetical protein
LDPYLVDEARAEAALGLPPHPQPRSSRLASHPRPAPALVLAVVLAAVLAAAGLPRPEFRPTSVAVDGGATPGSRAATNRASAPPPAAHPTPASARGHPSAGTAAGPAGGSGANPVATPPQGAAVGGSPPSIPAWSVAPGDGNDTSAPSTGSGTSCAAASCLLVDGTAPGPAFHPNATGLNNGIIPADPADAAAVTALGEANYRGAPVIGLLGQYDWSTWDAGAAHAATTTLILSNLWQNQYGSPSPPTPWSNWTDYETWLGETVRTVLASGRRVTYWEVYNEPGWSGYYSPRDYASMTPADLLEQFLVAYRVIKQTDPSAAIIGPSIGEWSLTPVPPSAVNHEFDLGTFLRFAAAHDLALAAVDWHDNSASPTQIESDAAATEDLIRSLPQLGDPPQILEEYASQPVQPIPGWDVGFLAAAAYGGFMMADRSCWAQACIDGELDGLLAPDGISRSAEYWERLAYASMSGLLAPVSSSDPTVVALASSDPAEEKVTVLIGRDAGCAEAAWCQAQFPPGSRPAAPVRLDIRVHLPWTSPVSATVAIDPFVPGAVVDAPRAQPAGGVAVSPDGQGGQWVDLTIPTLADGDAAVVTVSS